MTNYIAIMNCEWEIKSVYLKEKGKTIEYSCGYILPKVKIVICFLSLKIS